MNLPIKIKSLSFGILLSLVMLLFSFSSVNAQVICSGHSEGCTQNSQCGWCSGGTCLGAVLRHDLVDCSECACGDDACQTSCFPGEYLLNACDCGCTEIDCYTPGDCVYPESCYEATCTLWSGWYPCQSNNWQYQTCTVGPYAIEWRQCNNPPPTGTPRPTATPVPSCTVNIPASRTVSVGESVSLRAVPSSSPWTIQRVNFISAGSAISSPSPASDTTSTYDTSVSGRSVGSGTVTAKVIIDGISRCEDTTSVNVTSPGPWWQVKDSDIFSQGNITSLIPITCITPGCQSSFDLDGDGGYPGIPIYSGHLSLGSAERTSSTGWRAKTGTDFKRNYSLAYFEKQIPQDTQIIQIPSSVVEGQSSWNIQMIFSDTYRQKML